MCYIESFILKYRTVGVFVGDGQRGDGAAASVSGERHAASSQSQEDGEEESLVCRESNFHLLNPRSDRRCCCLLPDADEVLFSFSERFKNALYKCNPVKSKMTHYTFRLEAAPCIIYDSAVALRWKIFM